MGESLSWYHLGVREETPQMISWISPDLRFGIWVYVIQEKRARKGRRVCTRSQGLPSPLNQGGLLHPSPCLSGKLRRPLPLASLYCWGSGGGWILLESSVCPLSCLSSRAAEEKASAHTVWTRTFRLSPEAAASSLAPCPLSSLPEFSNCLKQQRD